MNKKQLTQISNSIKSTKRSRLYSYYKTTSQLVTKNEFKMMFFHLL